MWNQTDTDVTDIWTIRYGAYVSDKFDILMIVFYKPFDKTFWFMFNCCVILSWAVQPRKRPRTDLKLQFQYYTPREYVQTGHHLEWFSKPYDSKIKLIFMAWTLKHKILGVSVMLLWVTKKLAMMVKLYLSTKSIWHTAHNLLFWLTANWRDIMALKIKFQKSFKVIWKMITKYFY